MLLLRYAEKELESRHKRAELAISGPQRHANKSCEIVECIYCAANASFVAGISGFDFAEP